MIKAILFACLLGISAAQYGGSSGYGPDGVRNRYFILGHGRGPISTTLGSGIYGTSLGGSGSSLGGSGSSHGGSGISLGGSGSSSYRPSGAGRYGSGAGHAGGASAYGIGEGSSSSAYLPAAPAYAPAPAPAPRAYAPAPRSYAPAPIRSHAPAPIRSYAPAAPSYAPAPVRSYSAPIAEYSAPRASYGGASYHDDLAQPTPYDFGYDVHNEHGDQQSRQETGDGHGNVKGSYGYRDSYGIFRHVDYVADGHGFRANVRTNEPGTDNQDPADVNIQVEHGGYSSGGY